MGMKPIPIGIVDSHQRLWQIFFIEYSNTRLIQYLLYTVLLHYRLYALVAYRSVHSEI